MLSSVPCLSLSAGLVECNFKYLLFQVQEKVRTVGHYQMGDFRHTLSTAWIVLYCKETTSIILNIFFFKFWNSFGVFVNTWLKTLYENVFSSPCNKGLIPFFSKKFHLFNRITRATKSWDMLHLSMRLSSCRSSGL